MTDNHENDVIEGEIIESAAETDSSASGTETLVILDQSGGQLVRVGHLSLQENPAAVYIASLGQASQRVMLSDLNQIASILTGQPAKRDKEFAPLAYEVDWAALRFQHTAAVKAALKERYNHNGANRMLCALRGVLKSAWRLGQMDSAEYQKAVDIGSVKGESLPAGRALSAGELRTLFNWLASLAAADMPKAKKVSAVRDAAEMAILYGAGLRRNEIVNVDVSDIKVNEEDPDAPCSIHVRKGKGSKERIVYATNGSRDALAAWMEVRGDEPGPVFIPIKKNGEQVIRRMTGQAIYNQLAKRALQAGIEDVSPHDMRRTFMSDLFDAGVDIVTVKDMAGHAKVDTTARYDRRGERRKKKAAEALFVPFVK
ncbi:MAG: integrase [Proteobacteria bacterium]|nr:MAG: integrase [Pseudomonadota bacterium]